jgi:O-antigen/teichoic acid export membrane protein
VFLTNIAHPILAALYSDRYDSAYPTMVALAWVAAMTLITNVFSPLAVALNQRRLLLIASGVALVANIALNLVLIPLVGALGAALATLATEVVVTAPLAVVAARSVTIRPRTRPLIAALLATVAWLATLAPLREALGQSWLMVAATTGVWLVTFGVIAPTWVIGLVRTARASGSRLGAQSRPLVEAEADEGASDEPVAATLAIGEGRP